MYGIYIIVGKNLGWMMEDRENIAVWKTKSEADTWRNQWLIHKSNYEVRKLAEPRRNKKTSL